MSIYQELGVKTIINAVGTYTVVGATRMTETTLRDMCEAARDFVEIEMLQKAVHRKVAELTRNEAAFLCNSCSTAIYLAAAAFVEKHCGKDFNLLSAEEIGKCECVALWGHHIPYDHAIEQLGMKLKFIGYPNMQAAVAPEVLEGAINENTAFAYFAPRTPDGYYGEGCMNLADFLKICHAKGIPVLADGAAQLPPKSNLWRYTADMGAELACFSGGKDLAGPQASGLLVGKQGYIGIIEHLGFPKYGPGRLMKIGREEIIALYSAIRQYVDADEEARLQWCENEVKKLIDAMADAAHFTAERTWPNQAGQPLPRAFVELKNTQTSASELRIMLAGGQPGIIAYSENRPGVYINPMCLKPGEMEKIIERFKEIDQTI